ncbi:MAG: ribonuclease Z [Flavobacteriaceae bacterium]|nr:ribonuclease Z [Flavobacteriaceae bacterium]MCY4253413.1 ribonuclease Z [Flavobacteriaceae bacterium]
MKLTILGCHSSTPRPDCFNSAQVLSLGNIGVLIDCGEGTQMQLKKARIHLKDIDIVLISHLHGDHFYGLIGFLTSHDHNIRKNSISVYGPIGLNEIIQAHLRVTNKSLSYPLNIIELGQTESIEIIKDAQLSIKTVPLKHRIYTNGFLIEYTYKDLHILYAYCSDTAYDPKIIPIIKGAHWLYHEATFLDMHSSKADQTNHSTAKQAALIALKAGVKKLIIGHYSARYNNYENHLKEAREIFANTELSQDLKVFNLKEIL